VRVPIALYLLALVARVLMAAHFPDPAYPDSYYYVEVARSLAEGRGLWIDFIWVFVEVGGVLPADPVLPIPSNAHWMPLSSMLTAPFMILFGAGAIGQLASFVLIGALVAPLTWAIARDLGASRDIALGAGVIAAIPGLLAPFMSQPDNFGIYQPLVAAALWFGARGLRGEPRLFMLAGLLAGLATLARTDGVLVLVGLGLVWLGDRVLAWRSKGARPARIPLSAAIGCVALFLLVMAPWWARQYLVFGSFSPSTATGKVLDIREFAEWNSITTPATLEWLFGQGLGPFVASRVTGLVEALRIYLVIGSTFILAPFAIYGAWRRRRDGDLMPFYAYTVLLFAANFLVFAVHVPGGTFIHSACALVPYTAILGLEGIRATVDAVARRRPSWDAERAGRVFVWGTVVFIAAMAIPGTLSVHEHWDARRQTHIAVAEALVTAGAASTDRLMSIDAGGFKYWTGLGGVVTVNDPIEVNEEVARAYDIRWLALDRRDAVPAFAPILDDDERPDWVGPAVWTKLDDDGRTMAGLYPVCFDPADTRCASETAVRSERTAGGVP
jgi:4-amino-4-deoxy-L-arabinose transferase-like glycosyltransferase